MKERKELVTRLCSGPRERLRPARQRSFRGVKQLGPRRIGRFPSLALVVSHSLKTSPIGTIGHGVEKFAGCAPRKDFTGPRRELDFSMGSEFEQASSPIFHTATKILVLPSRQAAPRRIARLASLSSRGRNLISRGGCVLTSADDRALACRENLLVVARVDVSSRMIEATHNMDQKFGHGRARGRRYR